uniref:Ricin B lectin domain-containing protein n=1 Tax=Candidatus Methanophaga sp. ANME-1 ERB7 TaxID=2759913 RepID=A0A7G9Z5X0_9EURY|nr:hypothetical protein AMFAPHJD_00029 [Methanosarcinales archaeon ANME-1 ERB7]
MKYNWTIGRDDSVPQQEGQNWTFGFSPADVFVEAKTWAANNSIFDLTLKPNWEIVVRAQSTEPEPQIGWAYYSANMTEVVALVTDDMGIRSVIARVNIAGTPENLTMTDDNRDAIYVATTTEKMVEDKAAIINAIDIEKNSVKSEIGKLPTPIKPLANGDYVITSKYRNLCLDVEGGSMANNANVQQWEYVSVEHQKWHLNYIGAGNYEITPKHSIDKCLEVADSRTDDGANVRQNECKGEVNQMWKLEDVGDGYYTIVNTNSDKCLDAEVIVTYLGANIGVNIRQWEYKGTDNQKWILQPVDSYPTTKASSYVITNSSGKCLAIAPQPPSNVELQVYHYGYSWQKMVLRPVGDGYFSIGSISGWGCLSIADGSETEGAKVVQESYEGSDDQRWKLESTGVPDYYKICAKHSNKCLAVNGDNVEQQEYGGRDTQRWRFNAPV